MVSTRSRSGFAGRDAARHESTLCPRRGQGRFFPIPSFPRPRLSRFRNGRAGLLEWGCQDIGKDDMFHSPLATQFLTLAENDADGICQGQHISSGEHHEQNAALQVGTFHKLAPLRVGDRRLAAGHHPPLYFACAKVPAACALVGGLQLAVVR